MLFACADVLFDGDEVRDRAGRIQDRGDGLFFDIERTVFASVGQLSLPDLTGKNGAPERFIKGRILHAGAQERAERAPHAFLLAVAGQACKSRVDPFDGAIQRGDDHRIGGGGQRRALQLHALFRLNEVGDVAIYAAQE